MSDFPAIEITLSRYRCFTEQSNATLRLEPGTTVAIVGKNNLGELTIQEAINQMALARPPQRAVLLFEDHRIASSHFYVPDDCLKVSTRAFLTYLQDKE